MNPIVERMQRAQQYLERAERLEGTGQPVVCATYVRRAGELIEETRTLVAAHRGPEFATQLAMMRAAQVVVDHYKGVWKNLQEAFRPIAAAMQAIGEQTQGDYVLGGPSKGGGS